MTKATFPINDRWRLSDDGECQWILQRANPKAKHDRNRWQSVAYCGTRIAVAAPKRHGSGYLKTPAGHHHQEWIHKAESAAFGADIVGLDGFLEISCGHQITDRDTYAAMEPILLERFHRHQSIETSLNKLLDAVQSESTGITP